jgi:DNA-binding NtrC family response regulator
MSKTILHLDDEADIRDLLSSFLQTKGYRVVSVGTPAEALRAARRETIDLIISDLQLDDADGLETAARLQAVRPDAPVIILTGVLIAPGVAQETIGKKVALYLEKTTPLARIHQEIARLIGA